MSEALFGLIQQELGRKLFGFCRNKIFIEGFIPASLVVPSLIRVPYYFVDSSLLFHLFS